MASRGNPWDMAYLGTPPWDLGRPQRAFADLARVGALAGIVLETGCGTGENVLAAAAHGANAIGVDISHRAIDLARAKAAERGIAARFAVADVLDGPALAAAVGPGRIVAAVGSGRVDAVIDSGTFHLFDAAGRARYAASVAAVLVPGGRAYLLCAADDSARAWGPPGLGEPEITAAFGDTWELESMSPAEFEVGPGAPVPSVAAWLVILTRT